MPHLIIDDIPVEVPKGTKVIDAAEQLGIMIPRFCYLKVLGAVGACRMCAVQFLAGPVKGLEMSCMVDAEDDMVVSTTAQEAVTHRKLIIEWLMMNHPHDCPVCDEGGHCHLQDMTVSGGHGIRRFPGRKRTYRDQYLGVFVQHEMNRCIHCYRCVRFYQEYAGYRDLGAMQIGRRVYFGRFSEGALESPFSGNLIDICPTGVYTDKPSRYKARRWDMERAPSLCIHCSLGCNTVGNAYYRAMLRQQARVNEKVNGHFICDRGRYGFSYANLPNRPRRAMVGKEEVDWDEALRVVAENIQRITKSSGPETFAALASPRGSLESFAMLHYFCRTLGWPAPIYFANQESEAKSKAAAARLDGGSAVSLREIEGADFILVLGADPLNEAPMLALAMRQAFRNGAAIAVIDPRPVALPLNFIHLPVAPTEIDACSDALVRRAIGKERAEKQGNELAKFYEDLSESYSFDRQMTDRIAQLSEKLAGCRKPVIVCGTDVVRVSTVHRAADHALFLEGILGECGLFYVLPDANAFGAALLTAAESRSFTAVVEGIEKGDIKALVAVEADPFLHFPDRQRLEEAFAKLELLIVLDYLPSGLADKATVFFPTTTHFETGASFVNQEGRIQYAAPVHTGGSPISQVSGGGHPPRVFTNDIPGGEPKPAWQILAELAGTDADNEERPGNFCWDIVADGAPNLEGLRQLPYPADGLRIIPETAPTLIFSISAPQETRKNPEGLLEVLLVDRTFGTEELAGYSEIISQVEEPPCVYMHAEDAQKAGLADGDRVVMHLDRGALEMPLSVSEDMAKGIVILPRHRRLDWQKMKYYPEMLPLCRIEKA